jgi:thiol-disulfide isomerase/thioredoxin
MTIEKESAAVGVSAAVLMVAVALFVFPSLIQEEAEADSSSLVTETEVPDLEFLRTLDEVLSKQAELESKTDEVIAKLDTLLERTDEPEAPRLPTEVGIPESIEEETVVTESGVLPEGWSIEMWTAPWCDHCERWKREEAGNFAESEVRYINFDNNRENARKYGVSTLPVFRLVRPDGKSNVRMTGFRSAAQLISTIESHANEKPAVASAPQPAQVHRQQPQPTVLRDQWGTYSSNSRFHCGNSGCTMCNSRRSNRQRWQSSLVIDKLPAGQQPAPKEQIDESIRGLNLNSSAKLADLGCGDGRALIAASQRSGCRGVGVELDARQAERARDNVRKAGLTEKIDIVHGDATTFDLGGAGVTHVYVFLFSDLLEELAPRLKEYPVASVFHELPGRQGRLINSVYLYGVES